jgi:hypothetical protein
MKESGGYLRCVVSAVKRGAANSNYRRRVSLQMASRYTIELS